MAEGQRAGWQEKVRSGNEGVGIPHYTQIWAEVLTQAPSLPQPSSSPSLCKSSDYTDLHNSCVIKCTRFCQAFRLYKAILLSLMESKNQEERFSVLLSLNTKSLQILSCREGQMRETK